MKHHFMRFCSWLEGIAERRTLWSMVWIILVAPKMGGGLLIAMEIREAKNGKRTWRSAGRRIRIMSISIVIYQILFFAALAYFGPEWLVTWWYAD